MQSIKVTVAAPSNETVTSLLAVAGLAGAAVSIGALAGNWWWTALTASLALVALCWIAQSADEDAEQPAAVDEPVAPAVADTAPWAADRVRSA